MKKIIWPLLLAASTLIVGCQKEFEAQPESESMQDVAQSSLRNIPEEALKHLVQGEVYMKLSEASAIPAALSATSLSSDEPIPMSAFPSPLGAALGTVKGVKVTPVFDVSGEFEQRKRAAGLHLWMKVTFDEDVNVYEVVERLNRTRGVSVAHEAYEAELEEHRFVPAKPFDTGASSTLPALEYNRGYAAFNDPFIKKQWHYENLGDGGDFAEDADINLFDAWRQETGKKDVIVAVIDGGVDATHEDLKESMWINPNPTDKVGKYGYNFADKTADVSATPHGTHVAGTIAARNNNGLGGAGIAGGDGKPESGVRVMSCQIFGKIQDEKGKSNSADIAGIANAFIFAADNGAVIAQNSWGWTYKNYLNGLKMDDVVKNAIDYFIKNAGKDASGNLRPGSLMKGGVVIFAAGNDGEGFPALPASYDATIAVSSMTPSFKMATYNNYGSWVDIMAPGGSIDKVHHGGVLSTVPSFFQRMRLSPDGMPPLMGKDFLVDGNEYYAFMQGTSMACPHVSGIAALVISKFGGPNFTNEDLKKRILTALKRQDINEDNPKHRYMLGKGYIDAAVALEDDQKKVPAQVQGFALKPLYTDALLSWKASADEDAAYGVATSYLLYWSESPINTSNLSSGTKSIEVADLSKRAGETISYKLEGLKENTPYYFAIVAKDRWGNKASAATLQGKTKENTAPVLEGLPSEPIVVLSETVKLSLGVVDKEGHQWQVSSENKPTGVDIVKSSDAIQITIRPVQNEGTHTFTIIVTDELGKSTRQELQLRKVVYVAPKLIAALDNVVLGLDEVALVMELADKFALTPGFAPTFEVESLGKGIATAELTGTQLVIKPKGVGLTSVRVRVSDGKKSTEATMTVRVVKQGNAGVYAIYPVPVRTNLNALTNRAVEQVTFVVSDLRGKEVFRQTAKADKRTQVASVDLRKLVPGSYRLTVLSSKETYQTMFVKN